MTDTKTTAYDPAQRYAAGSLWLTLGRLHWSLQRLPRARPGSWKQWGPEPNAPARLNQQLRLAADAWRFQRIASRTFDRLETRLDRLKAVAMLRPAGRPPRLLEYYLMAQALYDLQAGT